MQGAIEVHSTQEGRDGVRNKVQESAIGMMLEKSLRHQESLSKGVIYNMHLGLKYEKQSLTP